MLEVYKFEDKNKDEALKKGLEEISKKENEIFYTINEREGNLFKSKKYEVVIVKKEDVIKFIREYIKKFSSLLNVDIKSEIKEKDDIINVVLVTSNNAIVIGKEGKNINSLQIILRQTVKVQTGFNVKINIDVGNYKIKKMQKIEKEVRKIAKEVLNTKIDAKLDPMNSYERRLVHTIISEYEGLYTESEGEPPNRYVVIKYKAS